MKHLIVILVYDIVILKVVRWETLKCNGKCLKLFYLLIFTYETSKILPILGT